MRMSFNPYVVSSPYLRRRMSKWMITFPTYDKSTMKIHKGTLLASKLPFSQQQKWVLSFMGSWGTRKRPAEDAVGAAAGGLVFVEGVAIKARREASEEREKIKEPLRRT